MDMVSTIKEAASPSAAAAVAAVSMSTPTNKGMKKEKKTRKKKAKDMPKRPLSAYNIFFQQERTRLVAERKAASSYDPSRSIESSSPVARQADRPQVKEGGGATVTASTTDTPRLHRFTNGVGFAALAKTVAANWKALDSEGRRPFEVMAAEEKVRYRKEMDLWKAAHEKKLQQEKTGVSEKDDGAIVGDSSMDHETSLSAHIRDSAAAARSHPQHELTPDMLIKLQGHTIAEDSISQPQHHFTPPAAAAAALSDLTPDMLTEMQRQITEQRRRNAQDLMEIELEQKELELRAMEQQQQNLHRHHPFSVAGPAQLGIARLSAELFGTSRLSALFRPPHVLRQQLERTVQAQQDMMPQLVKAMNTSEGSFIRVQYIYGACGSLPAPFHATLNESQRSRQDYLVFIGKKRKKDCILAPDTSDSHADNGIAEKYGADFREPKMMRRTSSDDHDWASARDPRSQAPPLPSPPTSPNAPWNRSCPPGENVTQKISSPKAAIRNQPTVLDSKGKPRVPHIPSVNRIRGSSTNAEGANKGKRRGKTTSSRAEKVSAKKKGKRWTWSKKPGQPRRPLSAYNIFFSEERNRIIKELESADDIAQDAEVTPSGPGHTALHMLVDRRLDPTGNINGSSKRGRHTKTHGKIGFRELAKHIGQKWKNLPPDQLAEYKRLAEIDSKRYKADMAKWNQEQEAQAHNAAAEALSDLQAVGAKLGRTSAIQEADTNQEADEN